MFIMNRITVEREAISYILFYLFFSKWRLVEEMEHRTDQDVTEQKEQQKEREGKHQQQG